MWTRQLVSEVEGQIDIPLIVHCDNMGAIHLAKNAVTSQRSKHIDIRHHFVRDHVENNDIDVKYIGTESMPADVLTKPLTK